MVACMSLTTDVHDGSHKIISPGCPGTIQTNTFPQGGLWWNGLGACRQAGAGSRRSQWRSRSQT